VRTPATLGELKAAVGGGATPDESGSQLALDPNGILNPGKVLPA
jgi:FAD/FMN-containing dehydrogenase